LVYKKIFCLFSCLFLLTSCSLKNPSQISEDTNSIKGGSSSLNNLENETIVGEEVVKVNAYEKGTHTDFLFETPLSISQDGINNKSRMGYIDIQGNILLDNGYYNATEFHEGLAAVCTRDLKWFYINTDGNKQFGDYLFDMAFPFHEDIANVYYKENYYFLNKSTNTLTKIKSEYSPIIFFSEGYIVATKKGESSRYTFLDKEGNEAFLDDFTFALPFSEGLAAVLVGDNTDSKLSYINTQGETVFTVDQFMDFPNPNIHTFHEGIAGLGNGKYINTEGKVIIDITEKYGYEVSDQYSFSDGLACVGVLIDNTVQYGYINTSGDFVIEPQYEMGYSFSEGIAAVQKIKNDSDYQQLIFINTDGNNIISNINGNAIYDIYTTSEYYMPNYQFKNGICRIITRESTNSENKYLFINKKGNVIFEASYL